MNATILPDCPELLGKYITEAAAGCPDDMRNGLPAFQVRLIRDGLEAVLKVVEAAQVVDAMTGRLYAHLSGPMADVKRFGDRVKGVQCPRCGEHETLRALGYEEDETLVVACENCQSVFGVASHFCRGQVFTWRWLSPDGTTNHVAWNVTEALQQLPRLRSHVRHIPPDMVRLFVHLNDTCQGLKVEDVQAVDITQPVLAVLHPALTEQDAENVGNGPETLLVIDEWHRLTKAAALNRGVVATVLHREDEQQFRVTI